MQEKVHCEEHGECEACMICQHLILKTDLDYARVLVDPQDDDYETAMCEPCETQLLTDQEWSDALSKAADWKIFCRKCYERTLKSHTLIAEGRMS